jgi:predicted outer membrane repeat protein
VSVRSPGPTTAVARKRLKKLAGVLLLTLLLSVGIYRCARQEPVLLSPTTLEWHTGTDKPLILFVHGLGGDAYDTWGKPNHSFMEMIEADSAFADYAVASVRYPSNVLKRDPSLPQLATSLAGVLDHHFTKNTEIVIIAHSLGGIIARQALVQSKFQYRSNQLVTLITLATPFDGSQLPDFTRILDTFKLSSRQMSALGLQSDVLQLCESGWLNLVESQGSRIRQFAASEGKSIAGLLVVRESSATRNVPSDCVFRSNSDDHISIAKPLSLDAGIGKQVREWILNRTYRKGIHVIGYNLKVPAVGSLVFEAGANVVFKQARLVAKGPVEARGTKMEPVTFAFEGNSTEEAGIVLRGSGAAGSKFNFCQFRSGHGIGVRQPSPNSLKKLSAEDAWGEKETTLTSTGQRYGGAVLLIGVANVTFSECEFSDNQAYIGGAMALLGSTKIEISNTVFIRNTSGFGGGAIFAQASDFLIKSRCKFSENRTGDIVEAFKADKLGKSACGGGIYLGFWAHCNIQDTIFDKNKASGSGGAMYVWNTHPAGLKAEVANQLTDVIFSANEIHNGDGAALRIDGQSRGELANVMFEDNGSQAASGVPGLACDDRSEAGFSMTNVQWRRQGQAVLEQCRAVAEQVNPHP